MDPRKRPNPKTVNEIILDREIRHAIYLTRLGGGEAKEIEKAMPELRKTLSKILPPSLDRIDGGAPLSILDAKRLDTAVRKAGEETSKFFEKLASEHVDRAGDIAVAEADYEKRLFEKTWPIERNFKEPSGNKLRSILKNRPVSGKPITEWFKGLSANTTEALNQELRRGILDGESINDLMRRVRGRRENGFKDGIIGRAGQQAESLVRTGVLKASNEARAEFHNANSEVIKGYEWVLTLDSRTCEICVAGEAQNPYSIKARPDLPVHIQCRCVAVAVTKSWEELGLDFDEMDPGTRASMNGQVPEPMTYQEWFDKQSPELQLDILGPGKFQAYKSGTPIKSFVDNGKILTVKQIQDLESDLGAATANVTARTTDLDVHLRQVEIELDQMTDYDIRTLTDYTGVGYNNINMALRDEVPIVSKGLRETRDNLESFIRRTPKYEGRVWRGVDDASFLGDVQPGSIISDKAFFSTSTLEARARRFAQSGDRPAVFDIRGKNGVSLRKVAIHADEEEIIFAPGTKFRVDGIREEPSLRRSQEPLKVITLIEI